MAFLSKMKNAITSNVAKVRIEYPSGPFKPGDSIQVKVTVASITKDEVKSEGIFVDLHAIESGAVSGNAHCSSCGHDSRTMVEVDHTVFSQAIPLCKAFILAPKEVKVVEGNVTIPSTAQPTYEGSIAHTWGLRGRLEALGSDPNSGFQEINVR